MKTNTPDNIDKLSVQQVLDLIEDVPGIPNKKKRYKLLELIYDIMGYDLTNDVILALLAEPNRQLILATAGGGKTTGTQIKVVLEKIIRKNRYGKPLNGDRILNLVYNTHNVSQMQNKHADIVNKLYMSGVKNLEIDSVIRPQTVHGFCEYWKREYAPRAGLGGWRLMEESEAMSLMTKASELMGQKYDLGVRISASALLNVYNYVKENLMEWDSIESIDKFLELDLPKNVVIEIMELYEKSKSRKRVYDYTDMVYKVYTMIKEHEDVKARIQEYYEYITVDEIQDFTPLMLALLKEIVANDVPLVCIGDEDQAIYGFRGADINTVLKFKSTFVDSEVYALNKNRRCCAAIVNAASVIIQNNSQRYEKELKAVKKGGTVTLKPYNTEQGQLISLLDYIKNSSEEERSNMAVAYRDRKYSLQLVEALEENGIPFNVISGCMPFEHELYKHVENVLDILYSPYDRFAQINMYKVLSIKKADWFELIGYNPIKRKFEKSSEDIHFRNIDYGTYRWQKGLVDSVRQLGAISEVIGEKPMKDYFDTIFDMICKNFWYIKMDMKEDPLDKIYTEKVRAFFNTDQTYREVFKDLEVRRNRCKAWTEMKIGVTFSTFHGLKGLEFDEVHMIYMEDSIFPDFAHIEMKQIPNKMICDLKEAETRLCYVAMTRPRNKLILHYSMNNPSIYVEMIKQALSKEKQKQIEIPSETKEARKMDFTTIGKDNAVDTEATVFSKSSAFGRFF